MDHVELRNRTKQFALQVASVLARASPPEMARHAVAQLSRASTSVAANYRAVSGARSHAEFSSKLAIVLEETDECVFWLEYLNATNGVAQAALEPLLDEAQQLARIFGASRRTARQTARKTPGRNPMTR